MPADRVVAVVPGEPAILTDALLTGVAEIDMQHKVLFSTLSELELEIAGNPGDLDVDQVTRDLLAYVIYHFETEERLIKQFGYDAADPADALIHVQEHRGFADRIVALRSEAARGNLTARNELVSFLRAWLMNHIGTTDKRLANFIRMKSS
jgi:hemerythrin